MSAQSFDRVKYEGKVYGLTANPLRHYFVLHPEKEPNFTSFNSGCMRGYVADWEVRGDRLYLVGIEMVRATESTFASIFPSASKEGVFADWVNGDLNCPYGDVIWRDPLAFSMRYQFELTLTLENGTIKNTLHKKN